MTLVFLVSTNMHLLLPINIRDPKNISRWRHQMDTLTRYWPYARGIHRSPVNSPHIGQWRGALMFSLICAWINGWVSNRWAGDLRRHRHHNVVTVMDIQEHGPSDIYQLFDLNLFLRFVSLKLSLIHRIYEGTCNICWITLTFDRSDGNLADILWPNRRNMIWQIKFDNIAGIDILDCCLWTWQIAPVNIFFSFYKTGAQYKSHPQTVVSKIGLRHGEVEKHIISDTVML